MLYAFGALFTLGMAVDAVRRGYTMPWLWIILFGFPPLGGVVYLLVQSPLRDWGRHQLHLWRFGRRELERVAAQTRRIDRSEAWTEYATLLRERKRYRDAAEAAGKAAEKDPENIEAQYELGLNLVALDRHAEALEPLSQVVDEDPGYAMGEATFAYAEALIKTGQPEEALPLLERLGETSSRPRFLYGLASVQVQLEEPAKARDTLQRIIDEAVDVPPFARKEIKTWARRARRAQRKLATA